MLQKEPQNAKIKDFSRQNYIEEDEKDFDVKTAEEEKLVDSLPEHDDDCVFERDMYNFGDQDDLPESDRAMDRRCKNN